MKDRDVEIAKLRCQLESQRQALEELRVQLAESRETLRAIHEGEVDALVVTGPQGDCIFTLQGAEHAYRVLIEQMQEGAVTLIFDGTIRYCNRRFAEILRQPLETVIGTHMAPYVYEPDRAAFDAMMRQSLAGSARGDVSLCCSDGMLVPVHLGLSLLVNGDERSLCMVVTDLTERKRAEAILASEQFTRRLIESIPIGVAVIGRDLRHILANAAYETLTGGTPAAGRTLAEIFPPEMAQIVQPLVERVFQDGRTMEFHEHELPIRHRSWWNVSEIPLRDTVDNRIEAVLILTQDVTEQKITKQGLAAAKLSAEQANKAKDNFLAILSHELRTPLSAVIPAMDTLAAKVTGQDAENLELARRNVELEAHLINDLLDVTRIARGKIELERKPIDLYTVLRRAVEVCMPDIEARGLHFEIEVEDKRPRWVNGDPARLQQVFWNLIKNAVKFTPTGGCVRVRMQTADGKGVVEVVDNGHGIEPDHLPVLFKAFEQAERSITRQFGGLGLGLAISKAIVELHGGTIAASSEGRGKGATFTVQLPLLSEQEAVSGGERASMASAHFSGPLRILLVEDHGDTARILRQLLRSEGHEVKHAGDVATARALATAEPFDVLLSDLGLPDGSGHDLLRWLRKRGVKLKAIALSGYGMAADVQESHKAGFDEHVTKPVNFESLQQALNRVVLRSSDS